LGDVPHWPPANLVVNAVSIRHSGTGKKTVFNRRRQTFDAMSRRHGEVESALRKADRDAG
jgi:hypothetical protein